MTNELTPDGLYRLSVRSDGKVDAANRAIDGATVWCPNSDRYTSENPDTAAFIDGNYNLSDRPPTPSPSPSPSTAPDYATFRTQVSLNPGYLRIVSGTPKTQVLNTTLVWLLGRFGEDPTVGAELCTIWNAIAAINAPLLAEIASLNAIAVATRVPIRLNTLTGLMSII